MKEYCSGKISVYSVLVKSDVLESALCILQQRKGN